MRSADEASTSLRSLWRTNDLESVAESLAFLRLWHLLGCFVARRARIASCLAHPENRAEEASDASLRIIGYMPLPMSGEGGGT